VLFRSGKSLLAEEINQLVNNSIRNYIDEHKLDVLGSPIPSTDHKDEGNWDQPEDFQFFFDMAIAPEFEVKITEKTKFDFHRVAVSDKMVDEQIDNLTKRHGKLSDAEVSEDNDLLLGTFVELDENDEIQEGGIMNTSSISIEFVKDEDTKKKLIGLKPGDVAVLDPTKISSGPADMAKMLGIEAAQAEAVTRNFRLNVNEVKRMERAALYQELFDKLFGKDEVTSEEDFRSRSKTDIEKMFNADSDQLFKREVMKSLEEKLNIQLPDEFLKRWIQLSNEKPLS